MFVSLVSFALFRKKIEKKIKMKTIFCAIHGYVHFEDELMQIINTEEFQRLKNIRQLAAVHHVYPCATHTRFEHSIGVAHLAEKCCLKLLEHQKNLRLNPIVLKLAGLCHDLGHGPLSHGFDAFMCKNGEIYHEHEFRSVLILKKIVEKHNICVPNYVVEEACELIYPQTHDLPLYMYQIISNDTDGVDVDKLDYLMRDSKFTGLQFHIDTFRFFEYMRVIDTRLCYSYDHMQFAINNIFMIRHQLHALVYQHKVVRAIEFMYYDFMNLLSNIIKIGDDLDHFLQFTDHIFTHNFLELQYLKGLLSQKDYKFAQTILRRIHSRDLYKCEYEMKCKHELNLEAIVSKNTQSFIVDIVKIGYRNSPLYNVLFYDRDFELKTLDLTSASGLFSKHTQDFIYRVYVKMRDVRKDFERCKQ